MRLTDRMISAQNRDRLKKEREADFQQDDEDEMGYAYREPSPHVFLNRNPGVFEYKDTGSINTAPGVFEKTTVFHVSE